MLHFLDPTLPSGGRLRIASPSFLLPDLKTEAELSERKATEWQKKLGNSLEGRRVKGARIMGDLSDYFGSRLFLRSEALYQKDRKLGKVNKEAMSA